MHRIFKFNELKTADLVVDASYKSGISGHADDDPFPKLLGCGTQGGFRYLGSSKRPKFVVLYSSLADPDWPDYLDERTGQFIYYGDNKKPGHNIHDTPRKGNIILRNCFNALHSDQREKIPPFFIFTKGSFGRDIIFKGLAVPGAPGIPPTEDLVAVWKSKKGQRFQNYKAIFTILDLSTVPRTWIDILKDQNVLFKNCPQVWIDWMEKGVYRSLQAERTIDYRSKDEQLPQLPDEIGIIETIHEYFKDDSSGFEKCAKKLARLMDKNIVSIDLTRPWVDGGRDAVGKYRIGFEDNSIDVEFALEAKCYKLENAIGVKETSRLISRLRYRQFGIFISTSHIHRQAYKEIKEDRHPVIIISAIDIVKILKRAGYNNRNNVKEWLNSHFPRDRKQSIAE